MKKLFFILISMFLGQSLYTMEQSIQRAQAELSQEKKDELGLELNWIIRKDCFNSYIDKARSLIEQGANLNSIKAPDKYGSCTALMNLTSLPNSEIAKCGKKEYLAFMKYLIEKGADINVLDHQDKNALFYALESQPGYRKNEVVALLLDNQIDIYQCNKLGKTAFFTFFNKFNDKDGLQCLELILNKAIQLSPDEKSSLKNWLLVHRRLVSEKRSPLCKNMEKKIGCYILAAYVPSLLENVEKLNNGTAVKGLVRNTKFTREQEMPNLPDIKAQMALYKKYKDPQFLEDQVKKQSIEAMGHN